MPFFSDSSFGDSQRFSFERIIIYVIVGAVLLTVLFVSYLFFTRGTKRIDLATPHGGEEWGIGEVREITWKARGVERIGIALFKDQTVEWIAQDIAASAEKYDWQIYPGHAYGSNYWLAVFEYPWQKGNAIAYSAGSFAIVYPETASCDALSVQNGWPFVPSDLPGLRRVFITQEDYAGNLGGLEGADAKCQEAAAAQELDGMWHAFLGGEDNNELAVERLKQTPRQQEGVFIEATPSATLLRQATCHRLVAKDFDTFVGRLSAPVQQNERELSKTFFDRLSQVWLGKLDQQSKRNCVVLGEARRYRSLAESYSLTTTCQNWTQAETFVSGYPVPFGASKPTFPTCFTPQGQVTDAVAVGGMVVGLTEQTTFTPGEGDYCSNKRRLLCIEE